MEIRFCFEVDEKAGAAIDATDGSLAPAYVQMKTEFKDSAEDMKDENSEDYQAWHQAMQKMIADNLRLPAELLKPISNAEYDLNNEEVQDAVPSL
jgi:hypothetical protein